MLVCPNKSSKEWLEISKALGEDWATLAFIRNGSKMPESIERARELTTNRGVLEGLFTNPVLSVEGLEEMLVKSGAVFPEGANGMYSMVENPDLVKEQLSKITEQYGFVLQYKDDLVGVNKDAIYAWNKFAVAESLSKYSLAELSRMFLKRLGVVSVQVSDDVLARYGSNGVADIADRMIQIQSGMEEVALPEEALHFFIEMMPQDNPVLKEALDKIRTRPIYKQTFEQYKNNPNYRVNGEINFSKIRKEALAKELVAQMQEKQADKNIFQKLIEEILKWIRGEKITVDPFERLQQMFLSDNIEYLNRNVKSDEIYNQMADEDKAYYEKQIQTEDQKATLEKILQLTYKVNFNEKDHILMHADAANPMLSVTSVLGSDFISELDNPDVIAEIISRLSIEYSDAFTAADADEIRSKKLVERVIKEMMKGSLNEGQLNLIMGPKITAHILKALENKRKTLFGTAIHSIVEAVVMGKKVDLDAIIAENPDVSVMMDRTMLEKFVYGDINQPGILQILQKEKENGSVLLSELEVGNGRLGGVIDLVVIRKDGTAEVFDFKTKFLRRHNANKKTLEEEFYAQVNLLSTGGIKEEPNTIPELYGNRRSLLQKYTQQMSLYKRLLMEAGVRVGEIKVIGIPYTLDENTAKIKNMKLVMTDALKYDSELGSEIYFGEIDPVNDAINGPKTLREDPKMKEMQAISKERLKEAFGKMMARVTQVYDTFVRDKNSKITSALVDQSSSVDSVGEQLAKIRETLEGYEDFTNFMQTQKNFIDVIDSSGPIIARIAKEFDQLRKTTALNNDPVAQAQKLNELMKMKDFLVGYQKMFEELLKYFDNVSDPEVANELESNLIVNKINQMVGVISNIRNVYVDTITPSVVELLKDSFSSDQVEDLRREYNEMIASARARGDKSRAETLEKEMNELLPTEKNISEILKGNRGDAGLLSYFIATISNADMVIAGVAKRLKAALDRVRLKNKDLRDDMSKQLQKRDAAFGRGLNMKDRNESLVYDVETIDEYTGEPVMVRMLKSEFDEKLYVEHAKLKMALRKAKEVTDGSNADEIKAAKQALYDFQRKYMMSEFTEEFENASALLETEVMYNGERVTVRKIRQDIRDKIKAVQTRTHRVDFEAGNISSEDLAELQNHWANYYALSQKLDDQGRPKTGDALKIAEILEQYEENTKGMWEEVEYKGAYDRMSEKMKLTFGEDSQEYKDWESKNTRIVVKEEYYTRMQEIMEEMNSIIPNPQNQKVGELYKELRLITKAFKDKDGMIMAHLMDEATATRVKNIEEEIRNLNADETRYSSKGLTQEEQTELNELYFLRNKNQEYDKYRLQDLVELGKIRLQEMAQAQQEKINSAQGSVTTPEDLEELVDRYNELKGELRSMREYEETSYYKDELKNQRKNFALSRGITVKELANSPELNKEFQQTDWFKNNHTFKVKTLFDSDAGMSVESYSHKPIYIWTRNKPVDKYVQRIPGRQYFRFRVKDSYVNKNGDTVQLINKDYKDILGRPKPKKNEDYRAQYGTDHPFLNQDYVALRNKVQNNSASPKEKADYENLIYLQKTMLEAQENIEFNQRLGLAVPFMEKTMSDRVVETGGKNITDGVKSFAQGVKRKFTRDETDIDEGLPVDSEGRQLATVDNEQVRFIPVRYRSRGKISDASYDVWGGVLNYVGSINRKMELETELAMVNGLEEILGDKANQPKSDTQNLVFNKIFKKYNLPGLEQKLNLGGNRRLDLIKSFINSIMYNEDMFAGVDILGINTQKAVGTMMGISSFAILAGAPLNWTVNMVSGNVQNMIEALGGNVFDFGDYMSAKGVIYGNGVFGDKYGSVMKDMMGDYDKVGNLSFWGQMMEVFDPIQGDFENEFGQKTNFNAVKNILKTGAFAGKIWGEWEIQMSGFIAFMRGHKVYQDKVYDRDGFLTLKVGSDLSNKTPQEIREQKHAALLEFDKLETTLLDVFEMKSGKLSVKTEFENTFQIGSKQFSDIIAKLHSMQKRINGSYAKFDRTYAEKTSIGRMMFFFRKYVIPLGLNRWRERGVNYEGMQVEQGFYLTFLQTVGSDLVNFRFKVWENWNNYSDVERRAIKRTLGDVAMMAALFAMYSLLFGFDPDDEDRFKKLKEKGWGHQAMIYVLLKTRSETEQFLPLPGMGLNEINRIYSNPSLIFNEITRYIDMTGLLVQHTGNIIGMSSDDGLYYKSQADQSGLKDKGDSKLLAKVIGSLGYTGKTFNPYDAIKSYEYSQRIK